jgi:Holliday junction resolvase RusA-like endonuclease
MIATPATPALRFFVPGVPAPGGSKRAALIPKRGGGFVLNKNGRPLIGVRDDCERNKDWRAVVAHAAAAMAGRAPFDGPTAVGVTFVLRRPKGHFGSGRNAAVLRGAAPEYPTTKPDATKLFRALEDACTGIVWADDALIVDQHVCKTYGATPGAIVQVWGAGCRAIEPPAPCCVDERTGLFAPEGSPC